MARASFNAVDLSAYSTLDSSSLTKGNDYPTHGGTYSIGSVPFLSAANPYGSSAGEGVVGLGPIPYSNPYTVTITLNQTGIKSIYTLLDSYYGSTGTNILDVTLNGSTGTQTYHYFEGANTRDHYFGNFTNTVAYGINATVYWQRGVQVTGGIGYVRNDMQGFIVPGAIGDLNSITFSYTGTGNLVDGAPLLFGVTTSTDPLIGRNSAVPAPAALVPFLAGLIGMARRKRNS